jgi:hypothetical protein
MEETSSGPRWLARRARAVAYDAGVFFVGTRPPLPQEGDLDERAREHERRLQELSYEPLTQMTLPNALARIAVVADERTQQPATKAVLSAREAAARREAKRFLSTYGPLGYQLLKPELAWPEQGEPLGWLLAEAETVRFALDLISALQEHDSAALEATLSRRRVRSGEDTGDEERSDLTPTSMRYAVCRDVEHHGWHLGTGHPRGLDHGWYDPVAFYPLPGQSAADLRGHAGRIVANLVRAHHPSQEGELVFREGRFAEVIEERPLLAAIWLHVKRAALGDVDVRHCAACGAPFLVSDRRQQYCPSLVSGEKSRCSTRQQMRRLRQERAVLSADEEANE